jgi:2-oxoglutarate ferredoxin oxidoreductase subunit delta
LQRSPADQFIIREELESMAYKHIIDNNICKGCGLCITVCPKNVLEMSEEVNSMGYFPAYQARSEKCVFCTTCCIMCPDVAIIITKIAEET